jgi:hypothetical protein
MINGVRMMQQQPAITVAWFHRSTNDWGASKRNNFRRV